MREREVCLCVPKLCVYPLATTCSVRPLSWDHIGRLDDDDGERGVVRPIGIGIHSYVVSVVLMALDGPLFLRRSFHFPRSEGDSQSDVTSRRRRGSLEERSGLGFQEIVKTPGHLLAE